jgi:hypothetical protein
MTTLQHQTISGSLLPAPPRVVSDARFRAAVRERLVVLPQDSPGLAVRVSGLEKAVVLFPREGRVGSSENLLNFVWLSVEVIDDASPLEFKPMSREETVAFLVDILGKRTDESRESR